MSFSYDITTDLGQVRLNLTDTNQDTAIFSDEEIQKYLDQFETIGGATVGLLRVLKAQAAIRGDAARASAIDNVISLYPESKTIAALPEMDTTYPAPFPMDDAYEEPLA